MNNKDKKEKKYGNRNCVRVQDRTYAVYDQDRI